MPISDFLPQNFSSYSCLIKGHSILLVLQAKSYGTDLDGSVFLNPNSQCISKSFWLYCVNIILTPLPGQHLGPSPHHLPKGHKNSTLNAVLPCLLQPYHLCTSSTRVGNHGKRLPGHCLTRDVCHTHVRPGDPSLSCFTTCAPHLAPCHPHGLPAFPQTL